MLLGYVYIILKAPQFNDHFETLVRAACDGDLGIIKKGFEPNSLLVTCPKAANIPRDPTALHLAAQHGHFHILEYAVNSCIIDAENQLKGLDVLLAKDSGGASVVHYAAECKTHASTDIIHKIDQLLGTRNIEIYGATDGLGKTPVHYAALVGSYTSIQAFHDVGANLTTKNDQDDRSTAHYAALSLMSHPGKESAVSAQLGHARTAPRTVICSRTPLLCSG